VDDDEVRGQLQTLNDKYSGEGLAHAVKVLLVEIGGGLDQ
jgi:hypothetical protein